MMAQPLDAQRRPHSILALWCLVVVCTGLALSLALVPGHVAADEPWHRTWTATQWAPATGASDIQQEPIVKVDVDVRDEDDVALLHRMGYSCTVGINQLELRDGDELALSELGLDVRVTARALKVSGGAGAAALGEHSVSGGNWDRHYIPDYNILLKQCGSVWSRGPDLTGAPADARVTRLEYSLRIVHSDFSDVELTFSNLESRFWHVPWDCYGYKDYDCDDDSENDGDVEFRSRSTDFYNGDLVNQSWQLEGADCAPLDTGYIDWWYVYVYYWTCDPPSPPASPLPWNGAYNQPLDVDLDWADATGATSYDVYLGTSYPPPLVGNRTSSSYALPTLACGTTYVWQVVAKHSCGSSTAGPYWQFATVPSPSAPALISPADGWVGPPARVDLPVGVVLNWEQVLEASSYDVYLGSDPRRPAPLIGTTTDTYFNANNLACNTSYDWRVVAKNECGGRTSVGRDFSTGCCAPAAPSAPAPALAATGVPVGADLDWADATGATSYDVYFGPRSPPPFLGSTTASNYAVPDLNCETVYYWKVIARNGCSTTAGQEWGFATVGDPAVPSGPSPAHNATGVALDADLDWADSSGATSYDVYFGTTSPPPKVGTTSFSSYPLPALTCATRYYWKIVAGNSCGDAAGPVWAFTTACCLPVTPAGPDPADGATDVGLGEDLNWNDAAGATSYDVYFGTVSPPPFLGNTTSSVYALDQMPSGVHYYWKVVAKNSCGNASSEEWEFTTICFGLAGPSEPSPADGASNAPLGTDLNWDDVELATSYDVYFGTASPPPFLGNTTSSSFALAELACGTRYYWKVVAKSACTTATSQEWEFSTVCCMPGTPSGPSPANGATNQPIDVDLDWADNPTAGVWLQVFFGTSSPPPFLADATSSSYALPTLSYGTRYYWKIVAGNLCGVANGPIWDFGTQPAGAATPTRTATATPTLTRTPTATTPAVTPTACPACPRIYLPVLVRGE